MSGQIHKTELPRIPTQYELDMWYIDQAERLAEMNNEEVHGSISWEWGDGPKVYRIMTAIITATKGDILHYYEIHTDGKGGYDCRVIHENEEGKWDVTFRVDENGNYKIKELRFYPNPYTQLFGEVGRQ